MKILLAGYGYYVLGDHKLNGGTIMPSILSWLIDNPEESIELTLVISSPNSLKKAQYRINNFLKLFKGDKFLNRISISIKTKKKIHSKDFFDCGIIAIPEMEHEEMINFFSKHVKKVICVKPLGCSQKSLKKIIKTKEDSGMSLFIDFHKRYDEANISFINNVKKSSLKNAIFKFSYGQKSEMPLAYFKKWSFSSNPFQYLAPHYLDIIFRTVLPKVSNINNFEISGNVLDKKFSSNKNLSSFISFNLLLKWKEVGIIILGDCNWMETNSFPFSSRQRIEYLSEDMHIFSEQDNRGQSYSFDSEFKIPNPHFMTDNILDGQQGYGIRSYTNFFNSLYKRFDSAKLAVAEDFIPISKLIDFVNKKIKK